MDRAGRYAGRRCQHGPTEHTARRDADVEADHIERALISLRRDRRVLMRPMPGLTTHRSMPACIHARGDWASAGTPSPASNVSSATVEKLFNIEGLLVIDVVRALPRSIRSKTDLGKNRTWRDRNRGIDILLFPFRPISPRERGSYSSLPGQVLDAVPR
jgi:hypothetical protein